MKNTITVWILLRIHKAGLCKVFHWKYEKEIHPKGWCPILQKAHDLLTIKSAK